jgi:DeoR/GlpR family transcriptional regulator of sugar metabolism
MIDHSKFGHVYVATSLLPEEIDLLIADSDLPEEHKKAVQAAEINLELV